jgi:hypothetical protein
MCILLWRQHFPMKCTLHSIKMAYVNNKTIVCTTYGGVRNTFIATNAILFALSKLSMVHSRQSMKKNQSYPHGDFAI